MENIFTDEDREWLSKNGSCLVSIDDPEYPEALRAIANPPRNLAVLGNVDALRGDLISVVGSRDPARESVDWMETHLPDLIKLGVVIVSGGARGIDQRAHSLALRNGGKTVVVLPSGFQKFYPPDLERWRNAVLDRGGCFVSELAPAVAMKGYYFHQRNRIVVGLSKTLLLIEAKRKSGSSMTGRLARDNNRTVCAVPGAPTRANWGASLDLLGDGAFMVRDAVDVWLLHAASRF